MHSLAEDVKFREEAVEGNAVGRVYTDIGERC